jgi:hypothetical protein
MTGPEIVRRLQAFGKLWDQTVYQSIDPSEAGLRISYELLRSITDELELMQIGQLEVPPGTPFLLDPCETSAENRVGVKAKDGTAIEVLGCTIAGKMANGGVKELIRLLRGKVPDTGFEH